jgi:hypothetical protein
MRITATTIAFALVLLLSACASRPSARTNWLRDDTSIALRDGTNIVWRFNFDPKRGKPFFHPLTVAGGPSFTSFKPDDHPWHYGLWFSWKYVYPPDSAEHVNYWEEDTNTGLAQGRTLWDAPAIETKPNGAATIHLQLRYVAPSQHLDMTENREIEVSAPRPDGSYQIHWRAHFAVGDRALVLDRTPLLGEPRGQSNGGYGGFALRMPGPPVTISMLSTAGPLTNFVSDRARPNAAATAFNYLDGDKVVGGVALIPEPPIAGPDAPWYLVNNVTYRLACAAILQPKPIHHAADDQFDLNYTVVLREKPWTVRDLQAAVRNVP